MTTIYLIPTIISEDAINTIPNYINTAIRDSKVIFAEDERTARRFLKSIDSTIVIDHFEWHTIHKVETEQIIHFKSAIKSNKNIAIISEAGCPGIADPGQILISVAQEMGCLIKPLVGPNSILLALMASGMNGQNFEFVGYLPIDNVDRIKKIKEIEASSGRNNSTKIFIETPYRNNQLVECLLKNCNGSTKLCIGKNITGVNESIVTKSIKDWKVNQPELHKVPAIFLIHAY